MDDSAPLPLYEPTPDERSMATLAHALQIVGGFIAPLIIWLIKRDSRFVSFHALQALFWQIVYFVCVFVGMAVFMTVMFWSIATMPPAQRSPGAPPSGASQSAPPGTAPSTTVSGGQNQPASSAQSFPKAMLFFPLFWLVFMGMWVITLVLSIVYAIKASRGEWANYPLIGRLVRRTLHLPSGTPSS